MNYALQQVGQLNLKFSSKPKIGPGQDFGLCVVIVDENNMHYNNITFPRESSSLKFEARKEN